MFQRHSTSTTLLKIRSKLQAGKQETYGISRRSSFTHKDFFAYPVQWWFPDQLLPMFQLIKVLENKRRKFSTFYPLNKHIFNARKRMLILNLELILED